MDISFLHRSVLLCVFLIFLFFPHQPGSMEILDMFFIPETQQDGFVAPDQISKILILCKFLSVCQLYVSHSGCFTYTFNWPKPKQPTCFCLFFLRDRPNLLYFDIIKCATSVNVLSIAVKGLQCPTPQVDRTAALWCLWLCWMLEHLWNSSTFLDVSDFSVSFRCAWRTVPVSLGPCWTWLGNHQRFSIKASVCRP